MKLPGSLTGLGFALFAASLPACTCSPTEAPAPAESAPAASTEVTKASDAADAGRRFKLQRVDQQQKPPMVKRLERVAPLLNDAGIPKGFEAAGEAAPASKDAKPSP